jgi:curved DNA-binding protein CbpA
MLVRPLPSTAPKFLKAHYATVAHDHWPQTHPRHPTPYEILNQHPFKPYSRNRFNELVKLYHPDRKQHPASHICASLSQSVRLERYRLIVAAHAILSDPQKRKAYDSFGAGWAGYPTTAATGPNSQGQRPPNNRFDSEIWRNATWEDWQRYRSNQQQYQQQYQQYGRSRDQREKYLSDIGFASMVLLLSLSAGAVQHMYAKTKAVSGLAFRDERHEKYNDQFLKAQEAARSTDREGRIKRFVQQRDATAVDNDQIANLITRPDLCESGDAAGRGDRDDLRRKWK